MEKMYSLRQAANILGVKIRTLRGWVVQGKVNATKYPNSNRWYIAEDEIRRIKGVL